MIAIGNKAIEAFEQRAFSTSTGTGNEHQFARGQRKRDIFDCLGLLERGFRGRCLVMFRFRFVIQ